MSEAPPAIAFRNLSKRFGNCIANDAVNLRVQPGTIHALVGENGAGKSTAMKLLYAIYQPDSGDFCKWRKTRVGFSCSGNRRRNRHGSPAFHARGAVFGSG